MKLLLFPPEFTLVKTGVGMTETDLQKPRLKMQTGLSMFSGNLLFDVTVAALVQQLQALIQTLSQLVGNQLQVGCAV